MKRLVIAGHFFIHAFVILAPGGLALMGAYLLYRRLRRKRMEAAADATSERP